LRGASYSEDVRMARQPSDAFIGRVVDGGICVREACGEQVALLHRYARCVS